MNIGGHARYRESWTVRLNSTDAELALIDLKNPATVAALAVEKFKFNLFVGDDHLERDYRPTLQNVGESCKRSCPV